MKYDWPGNIRELEHLISRAALKAVTAQGRQLRIVTISLANKPGARRGRFSTRARTATREACICGRENGFERSSRALST